MTKSVVLKVQQEGYFLCQVPGTLILIFFLTIQFICVLLQVLPEERL